MTPVSATVVLDTIAGALVSQEKYNTIDRVLARHYGFSDEELDYLINYDIKYRLRADDGEDG